MHIRQRQPVTPDKPVELMSILMGSQEPMINISTSGRLHDLFCETRSTPACDSFRARLLRDQPRHGRTSATPILDPMIPLHLGAGHFTLEGVAEVVQGPVRCSNPEGTIGVREMRGDYGPTKYFSGLPG
jgi:hypothetical protein